MLSHTHTFTFKAQSLYVAYAPEAGVCCYGVCYEEAVNSLADALRALAAASEERATKRNGHAFR